MSVRILTSDQYINILDKLFKLGISAEIKKIHKNGPEYTSLMVCFLNHNLKSAECLLKLSNSFEKRYFPTTVGYTIVRPMFEIDVNAHYISKDPIIRAHQYIEYDYIVKKRQMDACTKHMNSNKPDWREGMEMTWKDDWSDIQQEINSKFDLVHSRFEKVTKNGKHILYNNWSGKSIREMAIEVDHEEAYDIFYADLSSFTHVDVRLADRFLRLNRSGMSWSTEAKYYDINSVFRYADIFLSCFLSLFGKTFDLWCDKEVHKCLG